MIRVLLADDEELIQAGFRSILGTDPELSVVGEAADGHEAVRLAQEHQPNVCLLDIRMPRLDGLAAAEQLRSTVPTAAVIILTTFSEDDYIARALAIGASGFVLKSGDPRDLLAAIHAVAEGGAYLSPIVADRIINQLGTAERLHRTTAARSRLSGLTERERAVAGLVGAGLSNAEIAKRLGVVEGTVKAHVSAVLARLGLANRVQLAILAYEAGLVSTTRPES